MKHHRRAAAFGLGAALISSAGQSFFIGLFGTNIRADLLLSETQWGTLYGLATGTSGVLMFWLGAMADRLSTRHAITIALGVLCTGAILMAVADRPALLLLGLFGLRLGGQGLTGHLAIVTATRHARHRGRSIATAALGFILGESLLPLGVTALLGWIPWRTVWLGVGCFVLVVAIPALRRLARPLAAQQVTDNTPNDALSAMPQALRPQMRRRDVLQQSRFYAALSVVLLSPFVVTAVFLHLGAVSALRGWTLSQIGLGFAGFGVSQAVTTWLAGRWVDTRGVLAVFRLYLLPLGAGLLTAALAPPQLALWALFVGLGMTAGANSVMSGALWADLYGVDCLGLVRGVYTGLMVLTTAISPMLFGAALETRLALPLLAAAVALYAAATPWLAARWLTPGGRLANKYDK